MSAEILHFCGVTDAPNRIRELRMARGWSQQRLADAVNMSKMNVSNIERGNVELNIPRLRLFAAALGVSSADILPHSDNPMALTPEEIDLISRLRETDEDGREQFSRVADALLPGASAGEGDRKRA